MASGVLLDTDVLIDHLRAGKRVPVAPADGAYSSITRAELYAGRGADEAVIDDLLGVFEEVPVTRRIAEEAGRIGGLALPDAIVAASAILAGRELLTRNRRHFAGIPDLVLHRPQSG